MKWTAAAPATTRSVQWRPPNHEPHLLYAESPAIAEQALSKDEFPVGCVIVDDDRILSVGERINSRGRKPSEIDHAEIIALRNLENLALPADRRRMTLYCTLEPCLMCFGAVLLSGIGTLVYAYEDVMGGGTACDHSGLPQCQHGALESLLFQTPH